MHDNTVSIINHISTASACRALCQDESMCTFATFYGADSFPFSETCVLLSSCQGVHDCVDCSTQDTTCDTMSCTSSHPLQSHLGDNLIQFLPDLEDQEDCRAACIAETSCTFFTHYNLSDPALPNSCFLLSSLELPLQPCSSCQTGPRHCGFTCSFLVDEGVAATGGLLLTSSSTVVAVGLGQCNLTVLAVGGGGHGYNGAAGGSGNVVWRELEVSGSAQLNVTVGGGMETSAVQFKGEEVIQAMPGGNGAMYQGGRGYSGGGGSGWEFDGRGGSVGGDGSPGSSSSSGGRGSGIKVATIPLSNFELK